MEKLLRAKEVAGLLDVSERYVYQLASEQKIPCVKFGKSVRFRATDINAWLDQLARASHTTKISLGGRG